MTNQTTDASRELLPCPHCDGPAVLCGPDNPAHEYWVRCCRNCCDTIMSEERAIKRWNTRATKQPMPLSEEVHRFSPMQRQELAEKIARYFAGYSFSRHEAAQCLGLVDVLIADGTLAATSIKPTSEKGE